MFIFRRFYSCNQEPVSRDIVSPHKTIRGMNKSIPPDGINRYRVSPLKLKLHIKHKMLRLNIRSVNVQFQDAPADLRHISLIYISFFSEPQFEKTSFKNLEQSLYLCILWF